MSINFRNEDDIADTQYGEIDEDLLLDEPDLNTTITSQKSTATYGSNEPRVQKHVAGAIDPTLPPSKDNYSYDPALDDIELDYEEELPEEVRLKSEILIFFKKKIFSILGATQTAY